MPPFGLSRFTSTSALAINVPTSMIYTAGATVEGELEIDFQHLQEENIEEVQLRLRGSSTTWINADKVTLVEKIPLVREQLSMWSRGGTYPLPGEHVLRIPFSIPLPEQLPPSFHYWSSDKGSDIRYSLTAVGVRKGLLNLNKRQRLPLAVVPRDESGAGIRAENATHGWKTFSKDDMIRRGLWGDYAKVHVELALPDIPVLPLFSDIPYTITITTTTAPTVRSRGRDEPPADKPLFPPVPNDPHDIAFDLRRRLKLRAESLKGSSSSDVTSILGAKKPEKRPKVAIESEVQDKEWAPIDALALGAATDGKEDAHGKDVGKDPEGKGSWVQRATFQSTFRLTCPPTFALHNIECNYELVVKVPFPGIGNSLKLEVPVTVTSGIDKPRPKEESGSGASPDESPILDLPPAYWDPNDKEWGDDDKE